MGVSERFIKRLKQIVDATGAKVVLSSDWRLDDGADYMYLLRKLWYKGGIWLYSTTPNIRWSMRGTEIREWLSKHEDVENYVVLDDTYFSDFAGDMEFHFVHTNPDDGLTDENVQMAIKILNGELNDGES